jgi:hypothetical protein
MHSHAFSPWGVLSHSFQRSTLDLSVDACLLRSCSMKSVVKGMQEQWQEWSLRMPVVNGEK